MTEISNLGLMTVFLAGVISFLSPCVLPLVPGYLSFISGASTQRAKVTAEHGHKLHSLGLAGCFVLGFSTVFVILGASASALSQWLLAYRVEANYIGGAIVTLFGLFMVGALKIPWLQGDHRFHTRLHGGHPGASYLLGLAFAFGWTPCIGPVLGAILTVSAVSATVTSGIALLSVYSLGLGLPFLVAAVFTSTLVQRLKTLRRTGVLFYKGAGVIMIVMGIAMITGYLSRFAYWLLATFPILGQIG